MLVAARRSREQATSESSLTGSRKSEGKAERQGDADEAVAPGPPWRMDEREVEALSFHYCRLTEGGPRGAGRDRGGQKEARGECRVERPGERQGRQRNRMYLRRGRRIRGRESVGNQGLEGEVVARKKAQGGWIGGD